MDLLSESISILKVGLIAFGVIVVAVAAVFIWKYKGTFQEARALLGIIIIVLSIPIGLSLVLRRTQVPIAEVEISINDLTIRKITETSFTIFFKTSQPTFTFIEFVDYETHETRPIISSKKDKSTSHEFLVNNVGKEGGKVNIFVDGKKIDQREIE